MNFEEFLKNIMLCYQEALRNPNHPCYSIVTKSGYQCEAFRCPDLSRTNDVKVMFLGLSPGNPEPKTTPKPGACFKDVVSYVQRPIGKWYAKNYSHAMMDRIGSEIEFVKANVVHGILDKKQAEKCIESCGNKFFLPMLELFHGLEYVIVYDFDKSKEVLKFVNRKLNISPPLSFENRTKDKSVLWNGVRFIAAKRTRRGIRRLSTNSTLLPIEG